tara:strand:- start:16634 stop:17824 length:1191 start_codon:yes stop_codon:yes gene_type:complete
MFLYLFPYKFTESFYKKHQIDILQKRLKTKVEIHDLSNILNKKWNRAFLEKGHKAAKVFNSIKEWKTYFYNIQKKEKKIYVVNLLNINSFNSILIHRLLNKSKVKILQFCSPEVCIDTTMEKKSFFKKIVRAFELLFMNPLRLIFVIKTFIYRKIINFLNYNDLYIFYAGKKKYIRPHLKSKRKKYINFNTQDYSNFLLNKRHRTYNKKNYIVFLDAPTPYFVGDKQLFKYKINYDTKKWYDNLNTFLKNIEKKFKSKVIIVPHPRVMKLRNPYYDKRFEVRTDIGATSKLVPNSKFVIAISSTTAVSYCVLNYKKILLIFNDQIKQKNPRVMSDLIYMSKVLKLNLININNYIKNKKLLFSLNKKVYEAYKFNYLTSKKVRNKLNVDIFNNILTN